MEGAVFSNKPNTDVGCVIQKHFQTLVPSVVKTPLIALFRIPRELGMRVLVAQPSDGFMPVLQYAYIGVMMKHGEVVFEWLEDFKKFLTQKEKYTVMCPETVPPAHPSLETAVGEIANMMDAQIDDAVDETSYCIIYQSGDDIVVKGGATEDEIYNYPIIPFLYLAFKINKDEYPFVTSMAGELTYAYSFPGIEDIAAMFDELDSSPPPPSLLERESIRKRPKVIKKKKKKKENDEGIEIDDSDGDNLISTTATTRVLNPSLLAMKAGLAKNTNDDDDEDDIDALFDGAEPMDEGE